MNQFARQTHLEFYREYQIAPVHYDLSNIESHLQRRFALYTKLGLPPLAFRQSQVLEVAAGTGHNSLYISALMPSQFVLLEPNPACLEQIHLTYENFTKIHTAPRIITQKLEEYESKETFDIVLCENWLGNSQHELSLLQKLSHFVANQGVLVLTSVSPVGFVPNLLRRFLAIYLAPPSLHFLERTEILTQAFGSHLDTLNAMTRNKKDWVQDNMLNPAYFGLCLTIPIIIEQLGERFDVISSTPNFSEDWRWFKSLCGTKNLFNEHFLSEYWKKAHCFLDYRQLTLAKNAQINKKLEQTALALLAAIKTHEDAHFQQQNVSVQAKEVFHILDNFIATVPSDLTESIDALKEVRHFINCPDHIRIQSIANMQAFSALFGRETIYISLIRVME